MMMTERSIFYSIANASTDVINRETRRILLRHQVTLRATEKQEKALADALLMVSDQGCLERVQQVSHFQRGKVVDRRKQRRKRVLQQTFPLNERKEEKVYAILRI